jgi:hypothetical protein
MSLSFQRGLDWIELDWVGSGLKGNIKSIIFFREEKNKKIEK